MRIVLVGSGNLATRMGVAAKAVGHDVVQVYSRTEQSAAALGTLLGCESVTRVERLVTDADLYVVALKDAALCDMLPDLCKGRENGVFIHTAGSMPMEVFQGLASHYGVVYPMQTFSKAREVDFATIPVFVEWGDAEARTVITAFAASLSRKVTHLASADRKYLHLAAVFACNFVNHCYAVADELLAAHGISFDTMLPLIDETAAKVHVLSPATAQTGPAVRYDENVIGKQRGLLEDFPEALKMYDTMTEGIHLKAMKS
ncbi:MAG: Rossmann-like and DUF2520 domain-containing protein [Prevotella sp.]